ncbi:centaurin-gamma-1A [Drosophila madeirensis]|uniref:Centaurin-gamma-1A n=1 Tax=Drosophila madeirensis TaxID=30013 RepID=A0AAU9FEU2_DROMD
MSNYHPHSLSHPHQLQVQNHHLTQPQPQQQQRHHNQTPTATQLLGDRSASSSSSSSMLLAPQPPQPLISNSLAIRQEIQRFESVHPSIYAIYDLIDLLPLSDAQIAQSIRDHVVCIEGKFKSKSQPSFLQLRIVGMGQDPLNPLK